MQARFYAPMYGRFLSPDPARDQHFEETQSWNIYSYVQNNPVMMTDPTGMWSWKETWDTTKGVANGWTNSNFGVQVFSASDTKAYRDGVVTGDVTAMLQGGHEMAAGAAAATGGTGVAIGSGGTAAAVAVPVALGGVVVAAHGAAVEANAVANLGKDLPASLSTGSGGGPKASTAPGQTANGQATDQYGNKLGGSGKPQQNTVEHSTKKAAKDAGRVGGDGAPEKHASPQNPKQGPHFHSTEGGQKIPNSVHHEYPE